MGCVIMVYVVVNLEFIGISCGYYKYLWVVLSWLSKVGRWGIIFLIFKISNLLLNDIFERKKCI